MTTETIKPPRKWRITVTGDVDDVRDAIARRIDPGRPMRDAAKGDHDGRLRVDCTVWADAEQLEAWKRDTDPDETGGLMSYREIRSDVEQRVSAALEELERLKLDESDPSYDVWQVVLGNLKGWLFLLREGG